MFVSLSFIPLSFSALNFWTAYSATPLIVLRVSVVGEGGIRINCEDFILESSEGRGKRKENNTEYVHGRWCTNRRPRQDGLDIIYTTTCSNTATGVSNIAYGDKCPRKCFYSSVDAGCWLKRTNTWTEIPKWKMCHWWNLCEIGLSSQWECTFKVGVSGEMAYLERLPTSYDHPLWSFPWAGWGSSCGNPLRYVQRRG